MRRVFASLALCAMFAMMFAFQASASARTERSSMSIDLTETLARAADVERANDSDLGGFAVRLLFLDQDNGERLTQSAISESGFIVYPPFEAQSGEIRCRVRMYEIEGLPREAIEGASMFDVLTDEEGLTFARYTIKARGKPLGLTREWKIIAEPSEDQSTFIVP